MDPTATMDPITAEQATGLIATIMAAGAVAFIIMAAISLIGIIAGWKVFSKAGQPGWAIFVPIYSSICFCRVIGKSDWWWLLMLIPVYGQIVIPIIAVVRLAKAFGKGIGFALGLIFLAPIFYLILAFGSDYVGFPEEAGEAPAAA
jgi:hypothetical protein